MRSVDFSILTVGLSVVLLVLVMYFYRNHGNHGNQSNNNLDFWPESPATKVSSVEGFVASNNETVREDTPFGLIRDDERVVRNMRQIVAEDARKQSTLRSSSYSNWKPTTWFEEELKGITHYVLKTINVKGNRRFVALDHISTKKEQTLDPEDRQVVNRWTSNLFIQEKNELNVHAWSMLITFTLIQKGNDIKITKLHPITDHFYKKPLVEGANPNDVYYKIMNVNHLTSPWRTSRPADGKDVLMDDSESERLLEVWHKDLKTPSYRCFTDNGSSIVPDEGKGFFERAGAQYKNRQACEGSQGTWDKPVEADNECPFYRANKNYPNRLGGLKLHDNRCENPVNTKTIGYRYVSPDPQHRPWCYNCKEGVDGPGSWGDCADEQRDPSLYPELGGNPDYAYNGDELIRYQNRHILAQRGLNWQKYPTNIRNITNKNQRQPVFNAIIGAGPGKVNLP